ncbi:MAG: GDYXXLXY domain-containing protein [Gammaproteobacteria bacterium]
MKKYIFILASLLVLGIFNYSIYQKESLKNNGEILLLELAPTDPRSLMQGDYMRLRYAIGGVTTNEIGYIVVTLDKNKVATFKRIHHEEPVVEGEKLLHYHAKEGNIQIIPDSFMFQEGQAALYMQAKYGVFRYDNKGNYILVGLADKAFQIIR